MGLTMLIDHAKQLNEGIWLLPLAPHEVQRLGETRMAVGERSVILVDRPTFSPASDEFRFDASEVTVLNVGTLPETVALRVAVQPQSSRRESVSSRAPTPAPPGDREFLSLVERELDGKPREAAKQILAAVRASYPGDLKRGLRLNFTNVPDNFWYIIVQPRARSLSITVRGTPDRFRPSSLDLKADRGGYTRFIVDRADQVDEVLRIIRLARKK